MDAMGGDYAPAEIVKGSLAAARKYGLKVILVGDEKLVRAELAGEDYHGLVDVQHAPEVIEMGEPPAVAIRRKQNSSVVVAAKLVKEGAAQAFVSAGSTGASMAAALLQIGRIKGIDRPAIASILPNEKGFTVLLDVGANVDCKPQQLLQFGLMGYLYAQKILAISDPRVGLLSVGEEETKGNELTLSVFPLLKNSGLNFIGNVEGRDIFQGTVDVVVCDGFVGNIVLKAGEGMVAALFKMLKEEITRNWLARVGMGIAFCALKNFRKHLDYTEYGGAPLLGVDGVSIICHGSSKAKAIKNAIRLARDSVDNRLVEAIRNYTEKISIKELEAGSERGAGSRGDSRNRNVCTGTGIDQCRTGKND